MHVVLIDQYGGELTMEPEGIPLTRVAEAWQRQQSSPHTNHRA